MFSIKEIEMKWRTIKEAPYYMVSDEGHVKSLERDILTFNGKVECYKHIPETYPLKEKDIRGYKNVSLIQYDKDKLIGFVNSLRRDLLKK